MENLIEIEISKSALKHNFEILRNLIGNEIFLAPAIKSNAYGHGMVETARLLIEYGADWLCVASILEAIKLREAGIEKPILLIGYVQHSDLQKITKYNITPFIYDIETASLLNQQNKLVEIFVKIDTGMSRQGVLAKDALKFIETLQKLKNIKIKGITTHFAASDELENSTHFQKQFEAFKNIIQDDAPAGAGRCHAPIITCANSAAAIVYPKTHFNLVRPGISIYGLYPSNEVKKWCASNNIELKPALTLKTKIALIKNIPKGSCVSYGCTYTAEKETKIAILPIGYYDGIDRRNSNNGYVLIRCQKAPIIGRVCMNITIADITDIENAKQEDEAVLIGKQGDNEICADEIAERINTINYEITTRLRESIPRVYIS